jgi:hypothetical protein
MNKFPLLLCNPKLVIVGFEILMAVTVKSTAPNLPSASIGVLLGLLVDPEDGIDILARNVMFSPNYAPLHSTRPYSSFLIVFITSRLLGPILHHLQLLPPRLSADRFPSGFATKITYAFKISATCITVPGHH